MTAPDTTPADVLLSVLDGSWGNAEPEEDAAQLLDALHAAGFRVVRTDPELADRLEGHQHRSPISGRADCTCPVCPDLRAAARIVRGES